VCLLLAFELAAAEPRIECLITSLSEHPIHLASAPSNLSTEAADIQADPLDVHVVLFNCVDRYRQLGARNRYFLWSHNLWDVALNRQRIEGAAGVVVSSEIQRLLASAVADQSVASIRYPIRLSSIPFFPEPSAPGVEVVCLGTKGLDRVLALWQDNVKPGQAVLHVIGGQGLYGRGGGAPPQESSVRRPDVVFHGVLGVEKWQVIGRCSYAIHNPLGRTECFPNALIEVLASGLPVVTTFGWGNGDILRPAGSFGAHHRWQLGPLLKSYVQSGPSATELRKKARRSIELLLAEPAEVCSAWLSLLAGSSLPARSRFDDMRSLLRRQPDFPLALIKNVLFSK
jgi:glycosyltransferase involved in cell wall biosynthesis